jgi:DNA-binding response OmpR family regulator
VRKTILIVDDEACIVALVSELLVNNEYNVLTASSGSMALQQSRDYKGEIHLLLSDFQLPGMSGTDLATVMALERPQLRVMLMSGLQEGMLVLKQGWHFLSKPFIAPQLRALVVSVVDPACSPGFSRETATEFADPGR